MNVLGPFKFTEVEEAAPCGCESEYSSLFSSGDTIAFQIPSSENCCGVSTGCPVQGGNDTVITEACFDALAFEINATYDQDTSYSASGICFNYLSSPVAEDYMFRVPLSITSGTKYRVTVCISGNDYDLTMKLYIGSVDSDTFTGNGTITKTITAADTGGGIYVGIKHEANPPDGLVICFSCFSICEAVTWTATLVDSDLAHVTDMTESVLDNGNVMVELTVTIPGEIPAGCYFIKLVNDCDAHTWYSQSLKLAASHSCTLLFKWQDSKNVFGFDYTTDTTYYNYLRLKARLKHPTFPDESGVFRLSDNTNVLTNAVVQKLLTVALDAPGVPDYIHQSIALMRRHQTLLIDGTSYKAEEGSYDPQWRKSSELAISDFRVYDQDFDGVNGYCS